MIILPWNEPLNIFGSRTNVTVMNAIHLALPIMGHPGGGHPPSSATHPKYRGTIRQCVKPIICAEYSKSENRQCRPTQLPNSAMRQLHTSPRGRCFSTRKWMVSSARQDDSRVDLPTNQDLNLQPTNFWGPMLLFQVLNPEPWNLWKTKH